MMELGEVSFIMCELGELGASSLKMMELGHGYQRSYIYQHWKVLSNHSHLQNTKDCIMWFVFQLHNREIPSNEAIVDTSDTFNILVD